MLPGLKKIIVITGHYGSGKTNFALNLACMLRSEGENVALADLDVVNPYFRTSGFRELASENGIELIASDYAYERTSLDIPALTGRLDAVIGGGAILIIDSGGDDVGAVALGRYAAHITEVGYSMLYVINAYRYLTQSPEECLGLLSEIEAVSRLKATHIVNNSNLGVETTADDLLKSLFYADRVSATSGLPIFCTTAKHTLTDDLSDITGLMPVKIYVTAPWNMEA